jgi:NADPH:quinone reductase
MKALLCTQHGPPEALELREVPSPECGPFAVRIGVHAAGVNFPDTLIIAGKYQFQPPLPFSPGGEVAGVVLEAGAKVTGLRVGDRVMGLCGWSGFAEEVVVPAEKCLPIPEGIDDATAAAFGMTYGTSYYALVQRGRVKEGEWLVVHGASGGVGTAAIEIGKCLGARIIATGGRPDKLAKIRARYGLEHTIDVSRPEDLKDAIKQITRGHGADVVFDPVGGDLFEPSLRSMAWDGRLLVLGFASGTIPAAKANLALLKGCAIVGVFWGAFATREAASNRANFEQMFQWLARGDLDPLVTLRVPLARGGEAIRALMDREVTGKAVVDVRA